MHKNEKELYLFIEYLELLFMEFIWIKKICKNPVEFHAPENIMDPIYLPEYYLDRVYFAMGFMEVIVEDSQFYDHIIPFLNEPLIPLEDHDCSEKYRNEEKISAEPSERESSEYPEPE